MDCGWKAEVDQRLSGPSRPLLVMAGRTPIAGREHVAESNWNVMRLLPGLNLSGRTCPMYVVGASVCLARLLGSRSGICPDLKPHRSGQAGSGQLVRCRQRVSAQVCIARRGLRLGVTQ